MKKVSEEKYRKIISENMELLDRAIESGEYPKLSALLLSYRKSLYRKLLALHRYFSKYGNDERQRISYHEGRGWEMMLSYDVMTTLGAGKDKRTWEKAILKLCALQMLGCFRPRKGEYGYLNSPVQQLSAQRAIEEKHKPVTWYRVPRYTEKLLRIAEEKAEAVKKAGNGINKDAIRDVVGSEKANKITDTGYEIHKATSMRRAILRAQVRIDIEKNGYTKKEKVIDACYGRSLHSTEIFGYRERWVETWKAYKPLLFEELKLKEGRPTKVEKERWRLNDDSWIIRKEK